MPLWQLFINWFGQEQPLRLPTNPNYLISEQDLLVPPIERGLHSKQKRDSLYL